MSEHEELDAAVDAAFESEQLEALRRLVDQPSHTYARDDVEAAATILDELAEASGLAVARHTATDPRFAAHRVYAPPTLGDDTPAIALVGHIDTVFPRSSGFLEYRRDDDVARGPGVLDMKAGLTTILFAMRALRTVRGEDAWSVSPLRFICVTDEEVGSPSSRHLYAQLAPHLREALVFEHGRAEDRVIGCRKGGGAFTVTARGRAAHAGNDHPSGINAILALSLLIPHIEALTDYDRGVTVNVGLISGGTAKNTVPAVASCVVDIRFVTKEDGDALCDAMRALATTELPGDPGATFEVEGGVTRPPMERTAAIDDLRARYEVCARGVGLGGGEAPRQGGFSDANLIAAAGVPVIDGLGPAGAGAHSHDEWCDLVSLNKRTKALARFLATNLHRGS